MPSENLYNIDADLAALEDLLIESGGEITDELDDRLNKILDSRANKVDGYIAIIRSNNALAEGFKTEAAWYTAQRRARENVALRRKDGLYESMEARNATEPKGGIGGRAS